MVTAIRSHQPRKIVELIQEVEKALGKKRKRKRKEENVQFGLVGGL